MKMARLRLGTGCTFEWDYARFTANGGDAVRVSIRSLSDDRGERYQIYRTWQQFLPGAGVDTPGKSWFVLSAVPLSGRGRSASPIGAPARLTIGKLDSRRSLVKSSRPV
jgi:hypothetical protein